MTPDQIISNCEDTALRQFPDDELARALYLAELLKTKVRELAFVAVSPAWPPAAERIVNLPSVWLARELRTVQIIPPLVVDLRSTTPLPPASPLGNVCAVDGACEACQ